MSFNKAKSLKAASKYVQQGKYEAAIEEYRRIVQADPADVTTFNTLGDLYSKVGHGGEALRCFMHVAENYRANGFNLKAIAMLKKVSKLDPANVEVGLKLAALYAQQKLIVDARHQYLAVAEHYLREGQPQRALDIYQKVADLDPENTSIQIKLAEAYLREGQPEQAYEAFVAAAGEMRRQRKEEEALEVYLRALSANPRGQLALSSVINLYIQRNDIPNAVSLIERLLQERPSDAELLILLSRVHQTRHDLEKAEAAIARALSSDPARYQYALDLAALFLQRGDLDGALRQYDRVAGLLAEYREDEKGVLLLREVLGQDAHHFGALERLAAVYSQTHEDHLLIETLNTLAEAAMHQGRSQVAVSALGQLLQLEPDEIHHRRRLRLLGLSDDEVQQLHAPALGAAQEGAQFAEPQPATPPADPVSVSVGEAGAEEDDAEVDARPAPSGFAAYDPDSHAVSDGRAFSAEEAAFDSAPYGYSAEPAPSQALASGAGAGDAEDAEQLNLGDEIESIEFYLAQGMLDVARYTLNALTERFPRHPEVAAARAQLEAAEAAANGSPSPEAGQPAEPERAHAAAPPAADELDGVSGPVKWFGHEAPGSLLEDEGQTIFLLPPQAPMVGVGQVMESAASVAEAMTVAPPSLGLDAAHGLDAARPFELLDGPEAGELLDLLDEFKAEAGQQTQVEDFDTHYNLGLAYKDMEMFDEAVEEFQQAFKGAMSDPAGQNYVLCCSMLGFCFTRKNLPRLAVMWFRRGLDSPGHTEDEYQALRFDLAQAYASLGETQQAHDLFSEVYGIDVNYRGVKARLQELEQQMAGA
jgi:tetratricopeptide (TPR) repeat protein